MSGTWTPWDRPRHAKSCSSRLRKRRLWGRAIVQSNCQGFIVRERHGQGIHTAVAGADRHQRQPVLHPRGARAARPAGFVG